jgi:hypothetical protein
MQVLTGICVIMWLLLATETLRRVINGKMFFAPCLGTDLFLKRAAGDEEKAEKL